MKVIAGFLLVSVLAAWFTSCGTASASDQSGTGKTALACTYADGRLDLTAQPLVGDAPGLMVALYNAKNALIGFDLIPELTIGQPHALLYARVSNAEPIGRVACYTTSAVESRVKMRICRRGWWSHVDEGLDVTVSEAVFAGGGLLVQVSTRYIGMISGATVSKDMSFIGLRADDSPAVWYPLAPTESQLTLFVDRLSPRPHFIEIGTRDDSVSPFGPPPNSTTTGLFPTTGLCLNEPKDFDPTVSG